MTAPAPKSLARARELVTPVLAAAAESLSPELRHFVGYHWGWVDARGEPLRAAAGKALRPTLAMLSAEAVGAAADHARAAAAAVELIHDFTLLHDDVMDGDRERRGRATAWNVFGVGPALCAGDALVLLAQRVLLADASPTRFAALAALGAATEEVIAGQALDLAYEGRRDLTVVEYQRMASQKTGALLSCAASLGAVLTGGPADAIAALSDFGRHLGLSFQAVDDWLGIWGDPKRVGKPFASDLRQRKSSLPIVIGAADPGEAGAELRALLSGSEPLSESAIVRGVACLDATAAERETLALAERELSAALESLGRVALDPLACEALCELAAFVVARDA